METEISGKSFKQIKIIEKALANEYSIDKKNGDYPDMDFEFDDMDLHDSTNNLVANNTKFCSLTDLMSSNLDFMTASNLNIVENDSGTVIYYMDDDLVSDNSLSILDVLNITKKIVKLGRKGIQAKVNYNQKLMSIIGKLQGKLDNVAIDK